MSSSVTDTVAVDSVSAGVSPFHVEKTDVANEFKWGLPNDEHHRRVAAEAVSYHFRFLNDLN